MRRRFLRRPPEGWKLRWSPSQKPTAHGWFRSAKICRPVLHSQHGILSATPGFFVSSVIVSNQNGRLISIGRLKNTNIGVFDANHRKAATCGSRCWDDRFGRLDCFLGIRAISGNCMVAVRAAEATFGTTLLPKGRIPRWPRGQVCCLAATVFRNSYPILDVP